MQILTILSKSQDFTFIKEIGKLFDTDEFSEQYYKSLQNLFTQSLISMTSIDDMKDLIKILSYVG